MALLSSRLGPLLRSAFDSNRIIVLTALVLAFVGYRFGEKVAVAEGYGWDGLRYGRLVEDFSTQVGKIGLNEYHVQRILPSAVVYYGLRFLGVPRTRPNVICVFGLLNVAVVGLAAWIWCRLADHEKIGLRGKWLGFLGLFVNFAVLKWSAYYPVLTDPYAFLFGLLMLYCYITRRTWGLIALSAAGAFVWPALIYCGLPLLMFPRGRPADAVAAPAPWRLNHGLGLAAALVACAWVVRLLLKGTHGFRSSVMASDCGGVCYQPMSLVALISLAGVFLYLWFGLATLADDRGLFAPRSLLRLLRPLPLLAGAAVLLGTHWLTASLARYPTFLGVHDSLVHLGWMSIKKPGLFGVAHVVYFGPIFLLAVLRWRRVCEALRPYGLGLTLCVGLHVGLGLDCESRHLIHFLPVLVFGVVKAMEGVRWGALPFALFVLMAVVLSKAWLTIGGEPDAFHAGDFPAQLLFMNLGLWMSWLMYFVQGSYVLLAGCLLFALSPADAGSATQGQDAAPPAGRLIRYAQPDLHRAA